MDENVITVIAAMYATIVVLSYRKTGVFPALFWPITIVIAGTMVYMTVLFTEPPEEK